MGGGRGNGMFHGTKGSGKASFSNNLSSLTEDYSLSDSGYFGVKGKSHNSAVRNISSSDPIATARDFYKKAAVGGTETQMSNGKGYITRFPDGSRVSIREKSSSDGTPVVEITITQSGSTKTQKIHFVKE